MPMLEMSPIQVVELADAAAAQLRSLIVSGRLAPHERLIERRLAEQLGISRTPLRAALFELQRDGLVCEHSGRGLLVSPLSVEEITETYQLLAALERAALLHSPAATADKLSRLKAASKRRSRAADVENTIAADLEWHRALTNCSTNEMAKRILEPLRARVDRYERAFFSTASNDARSMVEHAIIEEMLEAGDTAAAADQIETHWLDAIEAMVAAVRSAASEGEAD